MTINIKDGIPANIALIAVLSVVNASVTNESGEMVYPKQTEVPVRGATIVVQTETRRKSDCFRVSLKRG